MLLLMFILLVTAGIAGGFIGSIIGLGGAVIIIPILTIGFGMPIYYSAGAALLATIATSSGAGSAYIRERIANMKIGMSLEIGTTLGAIIGSLTAAFIYSKNLSGIIFVVFGLALITSLYPTLKKKDRNGNKINPYKKADYTTKLFQMDGSYYDKAKKKVVKYSGIRWFYGEAIMFVAGIISGLLGVGSGVLKVLALDSAMNLPAKVSTSTSNFMIGVTAAVGSAIYWSLGYIEPFVAGSIVIGTVIGSFIGSKYLTRMMDRRIITIFSIVAFVLGIEMIARGLGLW